MKIKFFLLIVSVLFVLSSQNVYSQKNSGLKELAQQHMQSGRYGEAIDLLNKYITAYPQEADGYYLRGLCYEARYQYENAVLDLRRAVKLAKGNKRKKYLDVLKRVKKVWYAQLNKKIKGHKREIAIDPSNPVNYLEIGKSYRKMEKFDLAEQWYDEYLKRDPNASPDEIIRYTEILAKNNHIKKGEKILKKYVQKYPKDWRLWSRYGTFALWLGKRKTAIQAFETALSFKPYFQEALDGLDKAKQKPYVTDYQPDDERKLPLVDRLLRQVKRKPKDINLRFRLIDELMKKRRYEEAYQHAQEIANYFPDDEKVQNKLKEVTEKRKNYYDKKIAYYKKKVKRYPRNYKYVKALVQYYKMLEDYESAISVLQDYFNRYPKSRNYSLKYELALLAAWNKNFDLAMEILDDLIAKKPNNLKYKLLRAQVSVWANQDIETAEKYLNDILSKEPKNFDALIAMGSLKLLQRDVEGAEKYANEAAKIKPNSDDLLELENRITLLKARLAQERLFEELNTGRELVSDSACEDAIPYYEEYLQKAQPNDYIKKEYGDVLFCAHDYKRALEIYDEILQDGYWYDAALQKAKVLYTMGDSLDALKTFKWIVKEDSAEFEPRLYLGDTYLKIGEYDSARAVYDTLLTWDLDSTQYKMVKMRYDWVPVTGLQGFLKTFPRTISFAPSAIFYSDNIDFLMTGFGGRLDFGALDWLTIGVGLHRYSLSDKYNSRSFALFAGSAFLRFSEKLSGGITYGTMATANNYTYGDFEANILYKNGTKVELGAYYIYRDAGLILYSPGLIYNENFGRLYVSMYRLNGKYTHSSGFLISGYFSYITVTDGNAGNYFMLRVGKKFDINTTAGYEYYYANFRYDMSSYQNPEFVDTGHPYYYSPQNFITHSLWLDYQINEGDEWDFVVGGKLGYAPASSFVIFEGYGKVEYRPFDKLIITGQLNAGNSMRDIEGYRSISGVLSAYWTFYP